MLLLPAISTYSVERFSTQASAFSRSASIHYGTGRASCTRPDTTRWSITSMRKVAPVA
jgi:hypothetical protein